MDSERPVIGLNADYRAAHRGKPAYSFLQAGYCDQVSAAGGVPIIAPPLETEDAINQVLDMLDGFILCGGGDLDPRKDGFMVHETMSLMAGKREVFDRMIMSLTAERRMCVFGIGAGMQLLNVSQGGSLFFDINEDIPEALPHRDLSDPNHYHSLKVVRGSLMKRVLGGGEIRVNSMHHMAVDEVAPGFAVTARCPDGVVEAIESEMPDWFAFGTQFHPEAPSATALDLRFFEEFVDGVVTHTRRRVGEL